MPLPTPFGTSPRGSSLVATDPLFPLDTRQAAGVIYGADGKGYTLIPLGANVAAGGDTTLVALDPDKVIAVFALAMVCGATATDITFNSDVGSDADPISCLFANAVRGGAVLPNVGAPWFVTEKGGALTATAGAGSTTGMQLLYAKFPDGAWLWNDGSEVINNDDSPMK